MNELMNIAPVDKPISLVVFRLQGTRLILIETACVFPFLSLITKYTSRLFHDRRITLRTQKCFLGRYFKIHRFSHEEYGLQLTSQDTPGFLMHVWLLQSP